MRKKQKRFAFLVIGGLGLLAAIAPGLAATISTPQDATARPAAGQGTVEVETFEVTDINWDFFTNSTVVEEVTFTIVRKNGVEVTSADATVRIRLEDDAEDPVNVTDWITCAIPTADSAECTFLSEGDSLSAEDIGSVNIVAFDSTS